MAGIVTILIENIISWSYVHKNYKVKKVLIKLKLRITLRLIDFKIS